MTDSDPEDVLTLLRDGPMATHLVVHRVEGDEERRDPGGYRASEEGGGDPRPGACFLSCLSFF